MAIPSLPSSAAGSFMGGFQAPPSYGLNSLISTTPIISGPFHISQAPLPTTEPCHHVFSADNIARLLDNWTESLACAAVDQEANRPTPVAVDASYVGSFNNPVIPRHSFDATAGLQGMIFNIYDPAVNNQLKGMIFNIYDLAVNNQPQGMNFNLDDDPDIPSLSDMERLLMEDPSAPDHPPVSAPARLLLIILCPLFTDYLKMC